MPRTSACLVAFGLLYGVGLAHAQVSQSPALQNPKPKGNSAFRGSVVAADTNHPLRNVTVIAFSDTLRLTWTTLTNRDGRYNLEGLPPGRYAVSATKINYVWVAHGSDRTLGLGAPLELADGQVVEGVDLTLQRAGVITGRIVDEFNDSVAGVQVGVMRFQNVQGQRRLAPGRSTTTNDIGEFRLFGIAPGDIYVSATLNNWNWEDTNDRSAYGPTYYPGTSNPSEAQKLKIVPGQVLSGIDMIVRPVRAAKISGIALDSQSLPLADVPVSATQRVGGRFSRTQSRADGSFILGGLPPGEYTLGLNTAGREGSSATMVVTVNGDDISGLQLIARPWSTLRGRLVFDSKGTAAPRPSTVRIDTFLVNEGQRGAPVKDDGTFEIKIPPSHVLIRVPATTPEWRLKSVRVNGLEVIDQGFDSPPGGAVGDIAVELTDTITQLSGTVITTSTDRPRNSIIVFAQDPDLWGGASRYLALAAATRDNHYRVRIAPGRYYAVAVADVDRSEWNTPEFLAQIRDRAVAFSIADGESKMLDLNILAP